LAHFQNPRNAPSLLNSVFNRRQFWDGRVQFLEQTIFPNSASGANPSAKNIDPDHPGSGHHFDGLIEYLRLHDGMKKKYYPRFQKVFGIPEPTQDGIAKSLATYVRTLLSGNSVYDQAEVERKKAKAAALSTVHFDAAMDSPSAKKIDASAKREELVADLLLGYQIFHGKGRCFICHPNPLFTDHDFHNVGLGELADEIAGHETGRFPQVPVGVKEVRLIGAYRTPSLRNLPGSFPYTHDGRMKTLEAVIQYFNRIPPFHVTRSLAREFWIGPGQARNLDLTQDEIRSLVRFLRSLQGEPVDAKLLPQTK
jgi:cytochrome c peroxidase